MEIEQQLAHSTARLVVKKADGIHYGTGFFVAYDLGDGRSRIFCVTNRHVLANAEVCSVPVTTATADGSPDYSSKVMIDVTDIGKSAIFHPDASVDLAAFSAVNLLNSMVERNFSPFFRAINRSDLPPPSTFSSLGVAQDVLMVGYPNGLFDEANNMPIIRRGITATSPALNFNAKPEFMIDCACFPGSSGSPIFLHQPLGYRDAKGNFILGSGRMLLIGVLYAGPQVTISGDIVPVTIPTASKIGVRSQAMMHLGYCIRATELSFLDQYVPQWIAAPQTADVA